MKEIWKDIDGYEGLYQISNLGRVKRILFVNNILTKTENKILSCNKIDNLGYPQVTLCKNSIRKYARIHRLVAKAFIPNPNNFPCVNHIDGNKQNNKIDNLEWCSHKQNTQHAFKNNLINNEKHKKAAQKNIKIARNQGKMESAYCGENNNHAILTETQILEIRAMYDNNIMTQVDMAKKYGVHKSSIQRIVKRQTWKHLL